MYLWLARGPIKNVPLGVYDHPADPDLAPNITSVAIPLDLPGTNYGEAAKALVLLTKGRDKLEDLMHALTP
jgi:hypothetical protein